MSVDHITASTAADGASASPQIGRAGGPPLYVQVRDVLRQQIESLSLPPGAALPTEEALQAQFGVSRSVVRQALSDLAALGLVVRHRGRGSVVAPRREHRRRADQAGGLRQQMEARGLHLSTEIVSLRLDRAPAAAVAALQVTEAWCLERIRRVEDGPVVYMRTWLPHELFPHLTVDGLDGGSLHDWMRSSGVEPLGGPRQLQAVAADEAVASHLALPAGVPVLLLQGVTRDRHDRGLEWFTAWHRPDIVFDVDAQVGTRPAGAESPARADGAATGGAAGDDRLDRARELAQELARLLDTPPSEG
jgi:GntR family transcriptional regulator